MSKTELKRNAGKDQILFFDAQTGAAGDMTIAALLDLGVPLAVVEECVAQLGLSQVVAVRAQRTHAGALGATQFQVLFDEVQPERHYSEIEQMITRSSLDPAVKSLANAIFLRLGEAEAEVHQEPLDHVHFHEVGALDAIVDIVGSAACFCYLGAAVWVSPLPLGHGTVDSSHGILPLPAPATVLCLRGVPTYAVDIEGELVTPTGAAIMATVAQGFSRWPNLSVMQVGYGKGTRELPGRPNALRAVLGKPVPQVAESGSHVVVEANVDDLSGELAGHVLSQLLEAGALDAWAVPATMKKGRPGLILSALAPSVACDAVARTLLRESTTIGVRYHAVSRSERPRRMITVNTEYGDVPVKISEGDFGPAQVKPEFARCAELARTHQVPAQVVVRAALQAALKK
jgi:uncharacterized protein (TIGR00299 family) protein